MTEITKMEHEKRVKLLMGFQNAKAKFLAAGKTAEEYREFAISRADDTNSIQEQIWVEIASEAKKFEVGRSLIPMIRPRDNDVQIDIDPAEGTLAPSVAPGGAIPIKTEKVTQVTLKNFKIGTRPTIFKELIEDSLFDSVGSQLRWAGRRIQLREDSVIMRILRNNTAESVLTVADSSLTNNVDTAGTFSDNNLSSAIEKVELDGFIPRMAALHTSLMADARTEVAFATNAGAPGLSTQVMNTGRLSDVWNLSFAQTNTGLSGTADEIGGLILDKEGAGRFSLRRDTTVVNYEDPIHDLMGMAVTKRLNAIITNEDAICSLQR